MRQTNAKMSPIKNIIFDLGNVIIDIDIPATYTALGALHNPAKPMLPTSFFHDYETGQMSNEAFINRLQMHAQDNIQPQIIIDAWNAMLQVIPTKRIEMLESLRQDYNLYILSNTNDIHLNWVMSYLKKEHDIHDFDDRYFTKTYYSHLVKMRKPNREIYEYVLNDADINPEESIFIDDTKENVVASASVGIRSVWLEKGTEVADVLPQLLE